MIPPLPSPAERGVNVPCESVEEVAGEAAGGVGDVAGGKQKAKKGGRRCRKRKQAESCVSSFDYLGWTERNAWRRELSPVSGWAGGFVGAKELKDCFRDCDFPSECSWQRTSAYLEAVKEQESPVMLF
jgi:hypothetical protein